MESERQYRQRASTMEEDDCAPMLTPVSALSDATVRTVYRPYRPGLGHFRSTSSTTRVPQVLPTTHHNLPEPPSSPPQSRVSEASTFLDASHTVQRDAWTNEGHSRQTSMGSQDLRRFTVSSDSSRPFSKQYYRNARHLRAVWRPGALRRFPWRAAMALFGVAMFTASSTALVFAANKSHPESWKATQPQVYLSIFELLMSLLSLMALMEGLAIAFWVRLLNGCTLSDLHDVASPWSSISQFLRLKPNRLGCATMLFIISLSRGPFFQRSIVLAIDGENALLSTYTISIPFLVLGIIVSIAGILGTLPLFHGYWLLGRKVSLNPLEIARAFGAPVMEGLDGNASARDVLFEKGGVRVRYGAVEKFDGEKVLRVEDCEKGNVRSPRADEIFG